MNTTQQEAEILEVEERLRLAMLASDVEELQALISEDLLFVGPGGQLATQEMDLEYHRSGTTNFSKLEVLDRQFRCLEGITITVTKVHLAVGFRGQEFEGDYRYTRVWQKTAQGWRIIAGQCGAVA